MPETPESLLEFAVETATKAGELTLKWFDKPVEVLSKGDASPVTVADREAEKLMRKMISERFPEHGIIGEEFGVERENARVKWILDPIDGTVSFIHGIPLYTNLIGVTVDDVPVVGVINAPCMGKLVKAADGLGAWMNDTACSVRDCGSLAGASFMTSDVQNFEKHGFGEPLSRMLAQVRVHRTWGDAYGYIMVASGMADIMMDPVLNVWDAAAILPVMKEAGGSFTDLKGNARIDGGNGFACHPSLKNEILELFKTN